MILILTSPDAVLSGNQPNMPIIGELASARAQGNVVAVVSNQGTPSSLVNVLDANGIQHPRIMGRQSGEFIKEFTDKNGLKPYNTLVIATKKEDVQMGKNGNAVLVAGSWSTDREVKALGISVDGAAELSELIRLVSSWNGSWYYEGSCGGYCVKALANLSTYHQGVTQAQFGTKVSHTVKNGGPRLNALLAIASRSILMEQSICNNISNLIWSVYPSSNSSNADDEVLSDFTHRLRTTVSRVRFSKRGEPLFKRHKPSLKRSGGKVNNREDPTDQLTTLHLNPVYKGKLHGRHAIVVDDCTTHGTSFAVASALLKKAGVSQVTCIALGKFGSQTKAYGISITGDPFRPLGLNDFDISSGWSAMAGKTNAQIQPSLHVMIP